MKGKMSVTAEHWDSFWAVHGVRADLLNELVWRARFLFTRAYARRIARYASPSKTAKLLEVGSGSARTLHYLGPSYDTCLSYALDFSAQAVKVVRKISPEFHIAMADAFALPIRADEFDVCFSIGVIEHYSRERAAQMVAEKIRVTRPGGTIGIVVPWQNSVYNLIVRKAFGKYWPYGEENPFHRRELAEFMACLGLKEIKIHVIYGSALLGIGRKKG
jgi:SAM-dependent methyltransferase